MMNFLGNGTLVSTDQCHVWRQSTPTFTPSSSLWSPELRLRSPRSWTSSVVRPGPDEGSLEMLVVGGVGEDLEAEVDCDHNLAVVIGVIVWYFIVVIIIVFIIVII